MPNMNPQHRIDFSDPTRGDEAMRGIEWMLAEYRLPGDGRIHLGDHVLEVGAAFGSTTELLRREVPRLTAVEIDTEMAAAAAKRVAGTNAEVVRADASSLPFADGTFSSAVCIYMLHHVPTLEGQDRVLAEVCRVLRPGGVFFGWDSLDGPEIREYHVDDVFNPVDSALLPARLGAAGFESVAVTDDAEGEHVFFAARRPGASG